MVGKCNKVYLGIILTKDICKTLLVKCSTLGNGIKEDLNKLRDKCLWTAGLYNL